MLTELEKKAIRDRYHDFSQSIEGFKNREPQRIMIAEIAKVLGESNGSSDITSVKENGKNILVIEGPTGVGKSFAYLISGLIMAQFRSKTLVVSSATIALQEQLIHKDIPILVEHSGIRFSYALAKGRSHYLCPFRLYQITQLQSQYSLEDFEPSILSKSPYTDEEKILFQEIAESFSNRTFLGERHQWKKNITDDSWKKINNDRHGCLKNECPNRPECPFFQSRDALQEVDIIVVNHDLLLSDLSMGGGVILPEPQNCFYCIDEAHHLHKKALNHFSGEHSLNEIKFISDRLTVVIQKIAHYPNIMDMLNHLENALLGLEESFNQWDNILNLTDHFVESTESKSIWIWNQGLIPEELKILVNNTFLASNQFLKQLTSIQDLLTRFKKEHNEWAKSIDLILTGDFGFIMLIAEKIQYVWQVFNQSVADGTPPIAKWIVLDKENKVDYHFNVSPVASAHKLVELFWTKAAGVILTSATIRSLNNFDLFLSQTGLNMFSEVKTVALDSPFDMTKQAELYIPPLVYSPKFAEAHTQEIVEWIPHLIDLTIPVGSLFLFSSKKQMTEVFEALPIDFQSHILLQNNTPKIKLVVEHKEQIKANKASIIFGLDSFSEGLDLPGKECIQVIIAKLPFTMPDNPIDKTLNEWIVSKGGNPFFEITVPETSVKLLQAVGRLIRTESDYGRITILDNRLLTASYGRKLLLSLPNMKRVG